MTTEERIAHLTNVMFLMEYHEKLGGPKSKWMVYEWTYHNEQLARSLREAYDEAGNRKDDNRTKAGADQSRSESERRSGYRHSADEPTIDSVIRRPGD